MRNKITIKKSVKIVNEDGNNCYVIKDKRNSLDNTYNYLLSRSFDYFPDVIESGDKYYKYKYIEDTIEPREQKITDMVNLVTLLHSKTTFYKEVDIDNYKYIYENISNQIEDLYVYYEELITNIESNIYMSPSNYLIARNITIIFSMLNYAKDNLDKWYDMIKDKNFDCYPVLDVEVLFDRLNSFIKDFKMEFKIIDTNFEVFRRTIFESISLVQEVKNNE